MDAGDHQQLRSEILGWEEVIRADSELYSRLALHVADDAALIGLAAEVPFGQIPMNMLFGAVQYLLLHDPSPPLAAWYPSLGGDQDLSGVEAAFSTFVAEHRDQIAAIVKTRRVQTNEVARCSFLLPAYNVVNAMTGRPLALIEVGTSAGLNQNVDRYGYRYDSAEGAVTVGPGSAVQLICDAGETVPRSARSIPRIAWRTGLDLHPVNVADPDQALWLRALVWPDQVERHRRLAAAIDVAVRYPPVLVAGDLSALLPDLIDSAPADAAVVVQHSFVLNQIERSDRDRFFDTLDTLAESRSIYRVAAEWLEPDRGTILDVTIHGPQRATTELASVHHHGAWIRWNHDRPEKSTAGAHVL